MTNASVLIAIISMTLAPAVDGTPQGETTLEGCGGDLDRTLVSRAQRLFYNGDYDGTIALSDSACDVVDRLPLCEVRTSALLFAIKQALARGNEGHARAAKYCTRCQPLIAQFVAATARRLACDFPNNEQLRRFLQTHESN